MHGSIAVGFDIGSLCSKIAVAQKGGVDVIANETSKRKTPTLVAFDGNRRFIGESADSGWKRNIKNTIFLFKRFIGRSFNEEDVQNEIKRGLPYTVKEMEETGEVGFLVNYDGESKFMSAKQIMAIYLGHLKEITEKSFDNKIKMSDVVVGIPVFWAESQRRALIDAIKIAGLTPMELIEETTAIALTYGIYKMDLDEKNPINVIFYDLGHSSLQVALVSFTKSGMKVLATAYDEYLGGRDFDGVIVEKLLVMIKDKYKLDVRTDPRAFLRLNMAARQLRETLSANPKAPLFIECLMQDKDISFEFTREMFEELAKPLFERLTKPLEIVLEKTKLKAESLYAVELVGDTRATPKLQTLLTDFLKVTVSKTMNCSEAVAKGCAWQAAKLSPLFHVRPFKIETCNLFSIHSEFNWITQEKEVNTEIEQIIFPVQNVVPSNKLISIPKTNITEKSSIEINLSYEDSKVPNSTNKKHSNPKHFAKFFINNIPVNNENISKSVIKVGLKMNGSGICSISKAFKEYTETITYEVEEDVPIEETKSEQKTEEKTEQKTDEKVEQKMDTTEDDKKEEKMDTSEDTEKKENTEEQKKEETKKEEPKKEETKKEETKKEEPKKQEKPKTKKVKVQKKKDVTKKIDLTVDESTYSLNSKQINLLHELEIKMQSQDTLIVSTQIAKNAVESYVNEMKYELVENMGEYIEEQAKETFNNFLNETENWLYEEGENVSKSVYDTKLQDLKKIGDPVKKRYTESQDRQFYIDKFNTAIQIVIDFANSDDVKHEHISLEERDQIKKIANDAKNWLEENLTIIKNNAKHVDPPILCSQIISKQQDVEKKSHPIMTKPKPIIDEKKDVQPGSGTENENKTEENKKEENKTEENKTEEKNTEENKTEEKQNENNDNNQEKMDTSEDKQN